MRRPTSAGPNSLGPASLLTSRLSLRHRGAARNGCSLGLWQGLDRRCSARIAAAFRGREVTLHTTATSTKHNATRCRLVNERNTQRPAACEIGPFSLELEPHCKRQSYSRQLQPHRYRDKQSGLRPERRNPLNCDAADSSRTKQPLK